MFHLTVRVAWHDSRWNGRVCQEPSCNSFCTVLDRVREERDDKKEQALAGREWNGLTQDELPPCRAESGAFMSPFEWTRRFEHPYVGIKKAAETHGHLKPTPVKVPPFATFAVPFAWMLRDGQDAIDQKLARPLPPDEDSPFASAWVFGRARQQALLDLFFGRLVPERSLSFFYSKGGHPLGDNISRLVVGVGRITSIAPAKAYDVEKGKPTYLMWDRQIRHSIRPDGEDGFLLPYHEYLEPTGNAAEDERRLELLREIAVPADPAHIRVFSYAAELAPPDIALSTLVRCLESVRQIRAHGIAKGPWERREEWLNAQIALAWKDRGAFPGLGPVLEALGMRLGTALSLELLSSGQLKSDENPWPLVDSILRGKKKPPQAAYAADLEAVRKSWANLPDERRALLMLLSRFALTPIQAKRWFDPDERRKGTTSQVTDLEILENPYRMSEVDLGDRNDSPISVGMIDRGLLPDSTIAARHPVPAPSTVSSPNDPRRLRAALVATLRRAADDGDALLSVTEAIQRAAKLDLAHPCEIGSDWPSTNQAVLEGVIEQVDVTTERVGGSKTPAIQLTPLEEREAKLRSILSKRAQKPVAPIKADWKKLLVQAITEAGGKFDPKNERHAEALTEQAIALERVTSRRLTALVGRAGTGKTSVLGALMLCQAIAKDGILLLAPTGKARVRLGKATNAEAMTVAQFLYRLKRYDGKRQRPLFTGEEKYRKEKTVVIDESSMLTMDDLLAVLDALDLAHVQRIILVGDPNQLPPIGVGRPFADLVSFLETAPAAGEEELVLSGALARLTLEVRTAMAGNTASDTLRLASWFTRERQAIDADRVLSDLELGSQFNDLEIVFWKNAEDLHAKILEAFRRHLGLSNSNDVAGFDTSLGLDERGWVPFDAPEGSERWQILSPVRMHPHGVHDLNRWVQRHFRARELEAATNPWVTSLGDESIVVKDKVIQTVNQRRNGYDGENSEEFYLANGEVGLMATGKGGYLNAVFAGRPGLRFGYSSRDFPGGTGPLELAYALTVHKAQGSEFRKVFVVLPKSCRLLSRELLYTALTRSREQLVLLVEGGDASILFDLTRPERSETARRNTNLFTGVVRAGETEVPYAENLIHRTQKGHLVRSKSELVIANLLFQLDIPYEYERVCEGTAEPGRLRPDFSFVTPDGDLVLWEHLGMMDRTDYRRGWEWKRGWYQRNGFMVGKTLFTSQEDARGGLDSAALEKTALAIKTLLE
ncbi:AAA family ATPase [Archangium violaceum]|uniref:AAA family ATPase n=1 Tax=Archangium violaceum TaxID=83451 RepID=UPI00193C470D|nr:AAA family ATPase [Archangium violaceum]QRK05245.1 AAA family ATPase [Archangium violaceum]